MELIFLSIFLCILGIGFSYHERNIKKQFEELKEELKNETRDLKYEIEEIKDILSRN